MKKIVTFCFIGFSFYLSAQQLPILEHGSPEEVGLDSIYLQVSISEIIEEGIRAQAYPGANVLVAKNGKIIFHEAYGYWTYDSLRIVQKDHLYDYASVTKITAGLPALMKLYSEGKFDLDAPLKQYFPKMRWSNKAKLTFRQMLTHQAGLTPSVLHWKNALKDDGTFKNKTLSYNASKKYNVKLTDSLWVHQRYKNKMYRAIKKSDVKENPSYVYSDLFFCLVPKVIENITKEPFETYIKREFYQKIGASSITFNPLQHFPLDKIVPTERDTFFRKTQVHGFVHDETAHLFGGISGHAGLFSNIEDLAKLAQLYLNEGKYNGAQLFSDEAMKEFTRYQFSEVGNRRALGFDKPLLEYNAQESYVAQSVSPSSFGHSGYTGTFIWIDPEEELIFIFFSNRVYPDRSHRALYELNIRPRLHQVVYDAIKLKQ
jgi:CubicO group peptidase (beta-lactamase class C family)